METRLSARAVAGQTWKVKSTPLTRQYGVDVRTSGPAYDTKAWPGDIGTIVERTWTAHNGDKMSGLWLEFSRGRSCSVECENLADFVLVKAKRAASEAA